MPFEFSKQLILYRSRGLLKRTWYSCVSTVHYSNHTATFNVELLTEHGDVSPNPGPAADVDNNVERDVTYPKFSFGSKGLRLGHLNVRSLPKHLDEIKTFVRLNNMDIFAVNETWLNSTWNDHELAIDNYMIHRFDRSDSLLSASFSRGGGVAIYVKNSLHCRRINYEDSGIDLEYVCLEIGQHQSGPKFCFTVYLFIDLTLAHSSTGCFVSY